MTSTPDMRLANVLDDCVYVTSAGLPFQSVMDALVASCTVLVSRRVAVPAVTASASPA